MRMVPGSWVHPLACAGLATPKRGTSNECSNTRLEERMRSIFRLAILAVFALLATQGWAFTPPSSPSYCPWPAWKLPDAQPGDTIVYTDPHGSQYTKPEIDSAYDQVCWQRDAPDTGSRDAWMTADLRNRVPPERYAYGPSPYEGLDLYRTTARHGHAPTMIFIHGGAWRAGS